MKKKAVRTTILKFNRYSVNSFFFFGWPTFRVIRPAQLFFVVSEFAEAVVAFVCNHFRCLEIHFHQEFDNLVFHVF